MGKAEKAAEAEFISISPKKVKPRQKRRHRLSIVVKSLKEKRRREKQRKKVEEMLVQYLGSADAVTEDRDGSRRMYIYKCGECKSFVRDMLSRHLVLKHSKTKEEALMMQSRMRVLYLWCRTQKHRVPLPLPCYDCNEWYMRLDHHLQKHRAHKAMSSDTREETLLRTKEEVWSTGFRVEPENNLFKVAGCLPKTTPKGLIPTEKEFVRRAKHDVTMACDVDISTYIPNNSTALTDEHRRKWKISETDFFSVFWMQTFSLTHLKSLCLLQGLIQETLNSIKIRWRQYGAPCQKIW